MVLTLLERGCRMKVIFLGERSMNESVNSIIKIVFILVYVFKHRRSGHY